MKKVLSLLLVLSLFITVTPLQTVSAATKLNKAKISLNVGDTYKLKLSSTGSGVTWTSSDKTVATVNKGKVVAICGGTAVITAKLGKQQYKCTITVKDKKTDVIYVAYIFDDTSIEDYAKNYKKDNKDIIDAKVYDEEHIIVTMWESKRLSALKEFNQEMDSFLSDFIKNKEYDGAFTKIEADKLLQDITVYVDRKKYENSFAGLGLMFSISIVSDLAQAINLIDPKDRKCDLIIIDKDTGEIIE